MLAATPLGQGPALFLEPRYACCFWGSFHCCAAGRRLPKA